MRQILAGGHVLRAAWWTPDGIVVGKCLEHGCVKLVPPKGNMWCTDHRTAKLRERSRRWNAEQRPSRGTGQRQIARRADTDVDIVAVELACAGRKTDLNKTERELAVSVLTGRDMSALDIGERLGISSRQVVRDRATIKETP